MDSIRIDDGTKRICVNDDPARVITFNPSDVVFAEKFYGLIGDFETKLGEYQARSVDIENDNKTDGNGLPVNLGQRMALLREACEYIRSQIDNLFGVGTSQKAFGDTIAIELFPQFFEQITPYIQSVRAEKVKKYTGGK
jgi:hypothetical protein